MAGKAGHPLQARTENEEKSGSERAEKDARGRGKKEEVGEKEAGTVRAALVHSKYPGFCRWGGILFTPARGRWLVVRLSDGSVVTIFRGGKGKIHVFKS